MNDMPNEIWVHHPWINEQGHGTCCISDYACALDTRYIRADIYDACIGRARDRDKADDKEIARLHCIVDRITTFTFELSDTNGEGYARSELMRLLEITDE